ncbi:hypothetical protein [Streptomyces smyrnaeus]|uniref:hypothetical protein n=1 Tax=Streptomyces smyrnaeus TaxID=1387713 RepID=UPI0033D9339F
MSETGWAAVSAIAAVLALAAAAGVYLGQSRQADFALARSLHADLTSGEVAQAREVLGTLVHDPGAIDEDDWVKVRQSYFTLLWCFERVYAGWYVLASGGKLSRGPLGFLDRMIRWHVEYWEANFPVVKVELGRALQQTVKDGNSWKAFEALSSALAGRNDVTLREAQDGQRRSTT